MSTTTLFVEILIAGLGAVFWILVLLLTIIGLLSGPLDLSEAGALALRKLSHLKEWAVLLTTLFLSIAYCIGIFVDRIADSSLRWVANRRVRSSSEDSPPGFQQMRLLVMHRSEGMGRFLEYQRSRLRLARAIVFNLVCSTLTCAGFALLSLKSFQGAASVLGVGCLLCMVAWWGTGRINEAQVKSLKNAFSIVWAPTDRGDATVAAAICYRRREQKVEFLLVRTKGGGKWTFPKGHIEPGEQPWQAAAREALEEAGAVGKVEEIPLTNYLYPKPSFGGTPSMDVTVSAYLLEVLSVRNPDEHLREPRWYTPDEARARLEEGGREPRYVAEHMRVIAMAEEALKSHSRPPKA